MTNETARGPTRRGDDGPSLEQYVETRFALLSERLDEHKTYLEQYVETSCQQVEEKIEKTVALREMLQDSINERFIHNEKVNALVQDAAKRAVDKAEAAQLAHNLAANEWRGTLNDLSSRLVGRPEFERLSNDFAAYKLESARLFAAAVAEKVVGKEVKDDTKANWAVVISVIFAVISLAGVLVTLATRTH